MVLLQNYTQLCLVVEHFFCVCVCASHHDDFTVIYCDPQWQKVTI